MKLQEKEQKQKQQQEALSKQRNILANFVSPVKSNSNRSTPVKPCGVEIINIEQTHPMELSADFDKILDNGEYHKDDLLKTWKQKRIKRKSVTVKKKKFLKFCDTLHPPLYVTWPKTSTKITGKTPFFKDDQIDYDYDSDEEWDDGIEGDVEVIGDEGDDIDDCEEEEENDGWLVPDGYLSDDEREEGEVGTIGTSTIWKSGEIKLVIQQREDLGQWAAEKLVDDDVIPVEKIERKKTSNKRAKKTPSPEFPSELVQDLKNHVHGSVLRCKNLVDSFMKEKEQDWKGKLTKKVIGAKIKEIAEKQKSGARMWIVKGESVPVATAVRASPTKSSPIQSTNLLRWFGESKEKPISKNIF